MDSRGGCASSAGVLIQAELELAHTDVPVTGKPARAGVAEYAG